MNASSTQHSAYLSAIFSYEFLDGGPAYDAIERIHSGDFGDWVEVLEGTGLLTRTEIDVLEAEWRRAPRLLLDLLLAEADEVTARRCEVTWAALDRVAPIPAGPVAVFG
ncbi:hypothetical protein G4H71_02770 [Rhodococcus triatomae]|uniref:Uncharacterized protein n=1 Tax=Rhodococcus triatomae TaxID=300028 RepID=A0A1G8LZY3_9NOCA|nr:hypothetical protein [Rhodococcus triatomae]QNG18230.1 hypothetical protein G4H72_05270 [Rhodococcus triatomae]QNG22099.1 hypothetical protein G4H71_02770 [Rhodococcus triatomae]SDI61274.1 hypothetical protein SAMN05444695_10963 [Rhodococcus triatomae]